MATTHPKSTTPRQGAAFRAYNHGPHRATLRCTGCGRERSFRGDSPARLGQVIGGEGWDPTPGAVTCPRCWAERLGIEARAARC